MSVESERPDSLVRTHPPLRTLGDALHSCAAEFKSDRFWADLAKPIDMAFGKFEELEAALQNDDKEGATKARELAIACLEHLDVQMRQASEAGLFLHESRMIKLVCDTLKFDDALRLSSPLSSVAQAAHTMQMDGAKERQRQSAGNQSKLEKVKSAMLPFVFEHNRDSCEMTVRVDIPPTTSARDVVCRFTRETIRVSVKGHALQARFA